MVEAAAVVVDVGPQVVLEEVVGERLAARGDGVVTGAAGLVGDRVEQVEVLVLDAGVLARVEQVAALVHVGAHLEHLVVGEPRRGPGHHAGLAGDDVVARVPDDGVVVAEHAEMVGSDAARGIDVVDVVRDPVARSARRV